MGLGACSTQEDLVGKVLQDSRIAEAEDSATDRDLGDGGRDAGETDAAADVADAEASQPGSGQEEFSNLDAGSVPPEPDADVDGGDSSPGFCDAAESLLEQGLRAEWLDVHETCSFPADWAPEDTDVWPPPTSWDIEQRFIAYAIMESYADSADDCNYLARWYWQDPEAQDTVMLCPVLCYLTELAIDDIARSGCFGRSDSAVIFWILYLAAR